MNLKQDYSSMSLNEPLAGVRVLELGSMASGPFCGRLLGDFGAEVIKVEQPDGDPGRYLGEHFNGVSLQAKSIMRNKKNICANLSHEAGRGIVRKLAEKSDVVIENFRPGTVDKWGLGYDSLSIINPRLIMVQISGYGQTGPYSRLPGYGATCEAISGLRHMTGDPDRPPARVAVPLTDFLSGLYGAFAVMMALRYRETSGRGQVIDLALYEAAFSFMHAFVPTYEKTGKTGNRAGARLPNMAPNNLYFSKDGNYFLIAAGSQPMFRRLAIAMGRQDLINDPRFADQATRAQNEDELDKIIAEWVSQRTSENLWEILKTEGVAASPIYTMADVYKDPHFKAREMLQTVSDIDLGTVTLSGIIPKLSESPGSIKWSGAAKGSHTQEVLMTILGMRKEEIDGLIRDKVVSIAT